MKKESGSPFVLRFWCAPHRINLVQKDATEATPEHKEWFKALDSALSSMAASLSMSGTQRDELCFYASVLAECVSAEDTMSFDFANTRWNNRLRPLRKICENYPAFAAPAFVRGQREC